MQKAFKQDAKTSYIYLRNHAKCRFKANFEEIAIDYLRDAGGRLSSFGFNSDHDRDLHKLQECVIMRNVALSQMGNPLTRNHEDFPCFLQTFAKIHIAINTAH